MEVLKPAIYAIIHVAFVLRAVPRNARTWLARIYLTTEMNKLDRCYLFLRTYICIQECIDVGL